MRNSERKNKVLGLLICLVMLLSIVPTGWTEGTESDALNPMNAARDLSGNETADEAASGLKQPDDWETRLLLMLQEHDANPDTIGAGYYNLSTGEEHYYNGDQYRVSGSMYKVPLNMLILDMVADGKITMDEPIGGYRYSQLLEGTIIDSNNDYAKILWDYVGATIETNPASTLYHRYRILIAPIMGEDPDNVDDKYYENNFFTPRQMITCLRNLYDGGEKYDVLIETMQQAEPEKYFKLRVRRFNIAHKYGWFAEDPILYLNDCALCFTDDPIAIVLFTTGTENAYGVLTDFCTLMCNYAQETHADRIAREEEEAAAAALAAEQDRLTAGAETERNTQSAPAGTETAAHTQNTSTGGSAGTASGTSNGTGNSVGRTGYDWLHDLSFGPLILLGVIVAGMLAGIIWFSIRHRNSRLKLGYGIAAILLTGAGMLACFPGTAGWNYVSYEEDEKPSTTVETFFQALENGDAETADRCLAYGASSGLTTLENDEMHAAALQALRESWNHTLMGDCRTEKSSAWQEVQLRVLDFTKMQKNLQSETRAQLLELTQTMNRSSVYDTSGNYMPEAAGLAYDRAMMKLLEQPQNYYNTVGCRVELTLTGDGWKIVPTKALISALSGNMG